MAEWIGDGGGTMTSRSGSHRHGWNDRRGPHCRRASRGGSRESRNGRRRLALVMPSWWSRGGGRMTASGAWRVPFIVV
jgi:hypothetical protein